MPTEDLLGTLFGTMLAAALTIVVMSRFLHLVKRIITPLVTGIVVLLIGLTLIKVGLISMGAATAPWRMAASPATPTSSSPAGARSHRAAAAQPQSLAAPLRHHDRHAGGLCGGAAAGQGQRPHLRRPAADGADPLHYGLGFDWQLFVPLAIIFVVTALEAIGDMTATSDISGEPLEGPVYMARIKGGVLADGANSMLAAVFSTFPMSTFAQNNGVIQLTGVASRHVGLFIAAMLALLGLFPAVASLVQQIPEPVLGAPPSSCSAPSPPPACASSPARSSIAAP